MEIITAKISSNESRYWSQVLEFAKADYNLFLYLGFVDLEESAAERKSKAIASFIESQIIKEGDSFMVVTADIVSGLGIGVIKALLEMNQPASAIESLLTKLSTLDGNLRRGCLLAMSVASKTKVADSTILEPSQKTALSRLK